MALSRLFQKFQEFPLHFKLIGIGSLVLAISTLLPWYSDIDAYKIGDLFLGVTGPASFVGIVIFLLGAGSFGIFLTRLLERRQPKLPVRQAVFQLFVGVESLFLLLLVSSIYFHPKFGVNITLKESRFGMLLAFLGAVLLTVGGYLQNKTESKTEDLIGKLEPLIEFPKQVSETSERRHTPMERPKRWGPVEASQGQLLAERRESQRTTPQPQRPLPVPPAETSEPKDKESGEGRGSGGSFIIRTDL